MNTRVTHTDDLVVDSEPSPSSPTGAIAFGLRPLDLGVGLVALLLLLGQAPFLLHPGWSLRLAVLLAVLPLGLGCMIRLVRDRDRAAMAATAFAVAAIGSALVSHAPRLSVLGFAGGDTSTLIYVGVLALWAFGRTLDAPAARSLESVVVVGLLLNAAYGLFQVIFDVVGGDFNAHPGRASGFLGNPAYYGAVMSGGLAWAGVRSIASGSPRSVAVVTAMAFGFGLSGGRISLGIVMVLAVATLVAVRSRRSVTIVAAGLVGFGTALLTTELASRSSSVTRLSEQGGSGRLDMWRYGLHAWTERPVLGWGLGRTSVAVQRWITPEFANVNGRDPTLLDVHNIVVTLLVTTGAVGLALALVFAFHALRGATNRAALAFAVVVAMNWLLQPASLHTLPIAMLMVGAAAVSSRAGDLDPERTAASEAAVPSSTRVQRRAAIAVGLLLAGTLIASAWAVRAASTAGDPDAMAARAWIYRGDPVVSDMIAVEYLNLTDDDDDDPAAAIASTMEWTQRTVDADPHRSAWHLKAALRAIRFGDYELATSELDTLFEQQPGTFGGREARYLLAVIVHDEPGRVAAMRELCAVGSTMCDGGDGDDAPAVDELGPGDPGSGAG